MFQILVLCLLIRPSIDHSRKFCEVGFREDNQQMAQCGSFHLVVQFQHSYIMVIAAVTSSVVQQLKRR